ncbi:MAG TPA: transglutaminase family protein [Tepidisphaeraceae bacterium]|jgi:transglutaminase-like putative cysteine protease
MLIRVGFDVIFELPAPAPVLTNLNLHPSRLTSVRRAEALRVEPTAAHLSQYTDDFGNTCGRLHAPAGRLRLYNDAIVEDGGWPDELGVGAVQHPIEHLPPDVLQFLLASRYCEVDLLKDTAWQLFSNCPPGWMLAQQIVNWVHNNVTFGYQFARNTKGAADVFRERQGVCRDFAHLAVTFCRCMNIPARYVTGYLGDIGVPWSPAPMDFSAWFEVYLGGRWWTMDARHNTPRIGRVLMARGRDATDVALTTIFGQANLVQFKVWTDDVTSAGVHGSAGNATPAVMANPSGVSYS